MSTCYKILVCNNCLIKNRVNSTQSLSEAFLNIWFMASHTDQTLIHLLKMFNFLSGGGFVLLIGMKRLQQM